jgi:hypothetical protein
LYFFPYSDPAMATIHTVNSNHVLTIFESLPADH